jgi:hypothetical protein
MPSVQAVLRWIATMTGFGYRNSIETHSADRRAETKEHLYV